MIPGRASAASGRGPAIPGLIVAERAQPMPELPDSRSPGVEVCRDASGDLLGYCRAENGTLRVDMPNLASFSYEPRTGHVRAIPHRPLSPSFILDTYHHCVLPLILPALGTEVLHASAVRMSRGVVALCADSGTGKSTLAVGLSQRGYPLWADDATAVDTSSTPIRAIPLPFEIRLRPTSASFLGDQPARVDVSAGPAPLAALCLLERADQAGHGVTVEAVPPSRALQVLLAHAYCFSIRDGELKRRMVGHYLDLVSRVPVFEVRFESGLERLPQVFDAIEQAFG